MIPIYLINQDHEVNKWVTVTARLDRLGIMAQRVSATKRGGVNLETPWSAGPHVSQAHSHWRTMQIAMDQGNTRFMVLEDDVIFRSDWSGIMDRALSECDLVGGKNWDLMALGVYVLDGELYTPNVGHARVGWFAHAYVVNRPEPVSRYLESWLARPEFPFYEFRGLLRLYCNPMVAVSVDRVSMILGSQEQEFRELCPEL